METCTRAARTHNERHWNGNCVEVFSCTRASALALISFIADMTVVFAYKSNRRGNGRREETDLWMVGSTDGWKGGWIHPLSNVKQTARHGNRVGWECMCVCVCAFTLIDSNSIFVDHCEERLKFRNDCSDEKEKKDDDDVETAESCCVSSWHLNWTKEESWKMPQTNWFRARGIFIYFYVCKKRNCIESANGKHSVTHQASVRVLMAVGFVRGTCEISAATHTHTRALILIALWSLRLWWLPALLRTKSVSN